MIPSSSLLFFCGPKSRPLHSLCTSCYWIQYCDCYERNSSAAWVTASVHRLRGTPQHGHTLRYQHTLGRRVLSVSTVCRAHAPPNFSLWCRVKVAATSIANIGLDAGSGEIDARSSQTQLGTDESTGLSPIINMIMKATVGRSGSAPPVRLRERGQRAPLSRSGRRRVALVDR